MSRMGVAWCLAALFAVAGNSAAVAGDLKLLYEAAWRRQPEALSLEMRRDAVSERLKAARGWIADMPSLEASAQTDRHFRNEGQRELEAAIAVPLWLPGERGRSIEAAAAEERAFESRVAAARERAALAVRETYWAWQRARADATVAGDRLESVRRLAADVASRYAAGEVSLADRHQADAAVAAAEGELAEARTSTAMAAQKLREVSGRAVVDSLAPEGKVDDRSMEPMPPGLLTPTAAELEAVERLAQARANADLARVRDRDRPELTLGTKHERAALEEKTQGSLVLGVRIPLGGGARHRAQVADSVAEVVEAEGRLLLEKERAAAGLDAARLALEAATARVAAAERRATLARETQGFFDKSFRAGETDLPTRLRFDLEAAAATRQAARARIERAAAVSMLRQALGLLPE